MGAEKSAQGIAPAIMETLARIEERLARVEDKLDRASRAAREHWAKEDRRMGLVDQYVGMDIDLAGMLAQLREALVMQKEQLGDLRREQRDMPRTVATAVCLALSGQDLGHGAYEECEANGQ